MPVRDRRKEKERQRGEEKEEGDGLKEIEIERNFTPVLEADRSGSNEVEKDRLATVYYVVLEA